MLGKASIEDRLSVLEHTVSNLRRKIEFNNNASSNWLDDLIGSISDESAFLEALEYGRAFRRTGEIDGQISDATNPNHERL